MPSTALIYAHEKKERRVYYGPRPNLPEENRTSKLTGMMAAYLVARDLSFSLARSNDWYPTTSFKDGEPRIVIPCSNSASIPYFQARYMGSDPDVKRYESPAASREDSVAMLWPLGKRRGTVLTEGPMDALAAAELGFLGIALMGNSPNEEAVRFTAQTACLFPPVYLIPDGDALQEATTLLGHFSMIGLKLKMLTLPGKDLAELSKAQRKNILKGA